MKLVIVESPAKAKTIEKFLGKDYKVAASYGHIRDLPSSAREIPARYRKKSWARLAVDTEGSFQPIYVVPKENQARIKDLKKLMQKADEVLLATDEDREGESISWHLLEVLEPEVPVRRITFNEITRSAVQRALAQPRDVDSKLVQAQEARRVLDRLFGYELSPVLWKKVRTKLSAGRVQSAALRLVVEREEERQAFKSTAYWDVVAKFQADGTPFTARLTAIGAQRIATSRDFDSITGALDADAGVRVLDRASAAGVVEAARSAIPWSVTRVERKETRQRPQAPFTTSTLQQAAGSRLRMSAKQTMRVAQALYEGIDLGGGEREGLITYMRTDSVHLSAEALEGTATQIRKQFGEAYYDGPRFYQTRAKAAQEAHEAIRPTVLGRTPDSVARVLTKEQLALYDLIWRRSMASQMVDARIDRTTVDLEARGKEVHHFRANGSVLRFPGFLQVLETEREDQLLPHLEEGSTVGDDASGVPLESLEPEGHETRPPPRYTEATLVRRLEEEGIGRPSTYTPTLSTIQDRHYVVKKGSQLVPTYVGMAVIRLLREHFGRYVDLAFTAKMEDTLDEIASGAVDSVDFLSSFYRGGDGDPGLVQSIETELPRIEYPQIPVGNDPETGESLLVRIGKNSILVQRGESDERATVPLDVLIDELTPEKAHEILEQRSRSEDPIGTDDRTGEPIYLKVGPYGPYVQLGPDDQDDKPKRASLPRGMKPEELTLDYARKLLSLPRSLGSDPDTGAEVFAGLGRYGPYVNRERVYRNLPSLERVFEIGLDEAVELINSKPKRGKTVLKSLGDHPETGKPLEVVEGRYGPYVTDGKLNASIAKDRDPQDVTMDEAVALLAQAATRTKTKAPARRGRTRK
ncbi:MAG: type I DNA topoisomerase [Gemmatimonadota bacterium]